MIVAPFSLESKLPAGFASMLTPLLENVGLKVTPATVVAKLAETSITLADPVAGIAGLPPFSATVMAWEMDGPAPSGETVITVDGTAAPPISVEVGKLDSAVWPGEPMTGGVEGPTTATWTLTNEVERPAAASEASTAFLACVTSALEAPAGDVSVTRAVMTLAPLDSELPV